MCAQRSCQFASLTGSRSSTSYHTTLATCHPFRKSNTGMPNLSRCVSGFTRLRSARLTTSGLQELINFPPIRLPQDIREALLVPPANQPPLPESTPNPSLAYFSDDYSTPNMIAGFGANGNGNGNGNGGSNGSSSSTAKNHHQKMRIPMERR